MKTTDEQIIELKQINKRQLNDINHLREETETLREEKNIWISDNINLCEEIEDIQRTEKEIKELINKYCKTTDNTTEDIKQLTMLLEWYDNFVDYVQECNANIYNSACAYADDLE